MPLRLLRRVLRRWANAACTTLRNCASSQSGQGDCDEAQLRKVVQAAFAQRRKTLRNNLKGIIDADSLAGLDIDPGARAETLELPQFIEIANAVHA